MSVHVYAHAHKLHVYQKCRRNATLRRNGTLANWHVDELRVGKMAPNSMGAEVRSHKQSYTKLEQGTGSCKGGSLSSVQL